eukprot:TRINITY_DN63218_c0_g1_i1.p2 TRINITY_DN63218_c0_g1~~TRINITY_DN63218_c0_g1_i1.p2  ORF type:complete len:239 (-),score=42.24 TRINITY_DN63218_c0_g1_i1:210-869(-)
MAADLESFGGSWDQRQHAFSKHGALGKMIRQGFDAITVEELPACKLSRTLFVHAGVSLGMVQAYAREGHQDPIQLMREEGKQALLTDELETELLNEILQTRHLAGRHESNLVCQEVEEILKLAGAERLVLGHTPTPLIGGRAGEPLIRCGGRLLLMDVAMSRWMGGGVPVALQIRTRDTEEQREEGCLQAIEILHEKGEPTPVPILPALNGGDPMNEEL